MSRATPSSSSEPQVLTHTMAMLLRRLLLVIALGVSAMLAKVVLEGNTRIWSLSGPYVLALLIPCYFDLKAGRVNRGLAMLCWGIWLIVCVNGFFVAGIRTPGIYVMPVLIMTTAWVQGRRAAWWMTLGSLGDYVLVTIAEYQGWLSPPLLRTSFELLIVYGLMTLLAAALGVTLANSFRRQFLKEKSLSDALAELNETL